jgi:long-chain fatty acid transport protein
MMDMKRPMDTYNAVTQQPGQDGMVDAQYEESGSGLGFGASVGLLVKPIDLLSVGVSLKTKNTVKFEGTAKNSAFKAYNAFESDYARDLAWPLWYGAGIAFCPTKKFTVTADVQFSQWSDTEEEIITDYKQAIWEAQVDQKGQNKMHLKWKDATQLRFGAQYKLTEALAVRAGYYQDPAPAPDETANIIFPSISYNALTAGASYCFGKVNLDFGFEYLMGEDREIPFDNQHEMPGTQGMNIVAVSAGMSYSFK